MRLPSVKFFPASIGFLRRPRMGSLQKTILKIPANITGISVTYINARLVRTLFIALPFPFLKKSLAIGRMTLAPLVAGRDDYHDDACDEQVQKPRHG